MSRTYRVIAKSKPHHANVTPYTRTEKHKPAFGNYPNAEYEDNSKRW